MRQRFHNLVIKFLRCGRSADDSERIPPAGTFPAAKAYQAALHTLFSCKDRVKVVVIGANDGKINDPFYENARRWRDRTELLLIEPQSEVVPFLAENFRFHPKTKIHQGAVGEAGEMNLFRVQPQFWGVFKETIGTSWPEYRAPTGSTSADRQHVLDWIERIAPPLDGHPEDWIEQFSVRSAPLVTIVAEKTDWLAPDVIQIDAEGEDDRVIRHCNLERFRVPLVYFELQHLEPVRRDRLGHYLQSLGYQIFEDGGNGLAIGSGESTAFES